MSVKRYVHDSYGCENGHPMVQGKESRHGVYVLADEYDDLLDLLRQCVEALEDACTELDAKADRCIDAIAAAKAKLESEDK